MTVKDPLLNVYVDRQKVARTFLSSHHCAYDPYTLALTTETIITSGESIVISRTQDSLCC
jgi:hypothetical protein